MESMGMVERVARALSVADGMHPDACSNDEDETPAWKLYVGMARAAIEGMRIPTEAMIAAGHARDPLGCDVEHAESVYPVVWDAMLDAALREAGEKTE